MTVGRMWHVAPARIKRELRYPGRLPQYRGGVPPLKVAQQHFLCSCGEQVALTVEQAAEVLVLSVRTVKRDWELARAWLQVRIEEQAEERA